MTNISQIATQLADLYRVRKGAQIHLDHLDKDAEARKLAITPAEGWPGKNEETRKVARDIAFAADEVLQKIAAEITETRDDLADTEADIEALEVQFSAAKYEITYALAMGLGANKHEPRAEQVTAAAVERASDKAVLAKMDEAASYKETPLGEEIDGGADDWPW